LQGKGIKTTPRDVANKVVENVPAHDAIEKLEVAGPGFVNINISKKFVQLQVNLSK
jgi:arginyl-tRNA synthetase